MLTINYSPEMFAVLDVHVVPRPYTARSGWSCERCGHELWKSCVENPKARVMGVIAFGQAQPLSPCYTTGEITGCGFRHIEFRV